MTGISASAAADEIFPYVDALVEMVEGQELVSQNRWVDNLLDLYNLVDSAPMRRAVEATLSDIRHLGSVEAWWLRDQLLTIAAAIEVEAAFDTTAAPIR